MGTLKIIDRRQQVFKIDDLTGVIKITRQNGERNEFLFDYSEENFQLVSHYHWHVHEGYCSTTGIDGKDLHLTSLLFGRPPKGYCWHHLKDREDNRNKNLRLVSRSLNNYFKRVQENKTTGIRGISYYKGRYVVLVGLKGKRKSFKTLEEAVTARKKFEREMEDLLDNSPRPNDIRNYSLDWLKSRKVA